MVYYYAARRADGNPVAGSIDAASREAAIAHLRARALFITGLQAAGSTRSAWVWLQLALRRKRSARPAFFRSFATLAAAGISIKSALETLSRESPDSSFCEALQSMVADVEAGRPLSGAMERRPHDFSALSVAMVRAGEACGTLDEALKSLADLEERDRALRKRIAAALAYPSVVTAASLGLIAFLVVQTMPAFARMFEQMHVALPPLTRFLIGAGAALENPAAWMAFAAVAAVLGVAYVRSKHSDTWWAAAIDRSRLHLPLIGEVTRKSMTLRFARTLGSLLRAGVDVVAAVEGSIAVVDGYVYRNGLKGVVGALRAGEPFTAPLEGSGLFGPTFLQLVRAGEESGSLDAMLLRLAAYYEVDVESSIAALTSLIEPILICLLGGAIGAIVASVILPLYSMIGSMK